MTAEAITRPNEPTEAAEYRAGAPTMSSLMVHHADRMIARATPANGGAFTLNVFNDGWETFYFTLFTDDPALSVELAETINEVLAKHRRLHGQFDAPAAVAAE